MLKTFRASRYNVVVWIILALLIIGLAGFGITTGGAGARAVAEVGERRIETDAFARALDGELRTLAQQIGRPLPMAEARMFGVDRMVLARLINDATLDGQAEALGVSTGDATVEAMVRATPAFQGADGAFDREAYAFALERNGLAPLEFEAMLRAEATREIVAGAVQAPVRMPRTAADTILNHIGETRSFNWMALDAALLDTPTAPPDDAAAAAYHEANIARYTRPETRRITYAVLRPEALAATVMVPEEDLRAAYDAAGDRYVTPERRIADRIGFATAEEAAAALARIEAGETDFDAVAAERGLGPDEIDQGELRAADLSPEAAAAVFGAPGPGVVGPAPTPLGPSLFRVNAVLAANVTPFEAARDELRAERALEIARARIADEAATVDDLLAGGARIEEIVAETDFEAGTLALDAATTGGLADDPAFREAAEAAGTDEETDLVELADGGMATLRVDAVDPPAPIPLAEIRDRVAADWIAEENARRLEALAAELRAEIEGGGAFAALSTRLGRATASAGPLGRTDVLPEAPPGLVEAVFAAPPGGVVVRSEGGRVALAQVGEVQPFDPAAPGMAPLVDGVVGQLRDGAAADVLALFTQAAAAEAGVRVNQELVDQVLAQFP